MANELNDILARVSALDAATGDELRRQIESLTNRRANGLNFERHRPEQVNLVGRPISVGDKVRFIPPRGDTAAGSDATWLVTKLRGPKGSRVAEIVDRKTGETSERSADDLVFVADFRDPIFPGLTSTGSVERGGDTPFHTVINAENYHALEAMLFTHQGKVDVIYIDPPYNTGGKSFWLYNDNYVDSEDGFKHSKWLAFMERRLLLAKKLLAPTGVLFVSIDDAEQHRLRMLLDQVFGEQNFVDTLAVEMSTTSGPKTVNAQQGTIVKNVEFVHIYKRSAAFDSVAHTPLYDGIDKWDANYPLWLNDDGTTGSLYQRLDDEPAIREDIERLELVHTSGKRRGQFLGAPAMDILLAASEAAREFVYGSLDRIGRTDTPPVTAQGVDVPVGRWVDHRTEGRDYRLTRSSKGKIWQIYTLDRNYRMSDDYAPRFGRTVIRGDLWKGFHSDMAHVSTEGDTQFSNGKKPIRLIQQLIRWANNDPDALILDFFAGSGTTAHAVMAMNAEDGGRRRAIVVTNNELNEATRNDLRRKGLRPGDAGWEKHGVCQAVTIPRLINVATAEDMHQNVEFFTLTYLNPKLVELDLAFKSIAPLLWMRAGSEGRRIDERTDTFDVADTYGVLFDVDASGPFLKTIDESSSVRTVFIVTDDEPQFQAVAAQLPESIEPVRLYESYLRTFEINIERV